MPKIYTRTGDRGETSLYGGDRVTKDDSRVTAYGSVDELNALLGVAMATEPQDFERELLQGVQRDLFKIGSRLASPSPEKVARALHKAVIPPERITDLESAIDRAEVELEPIKQFVLPGGTLRAAHIHVARTVCRRAERHVVRLNRQDSVPEEILQYLNRLSDLLFVLARVANHRGGVADVTW